MIDYYFICVIILIFIGTIIERENMHYKERKSLYNRIQAKDIRELIELERSVSKVEKDKPEKEKKPKFI